MKRKILVVGSSNTDMTIKTTRLPAPGETIIGGAFSMGHGGKGANQAVAARRLGGEVEFVCKVGDDMFGHEAIRQYETEGIITKNVMRSKEPSGVALIYVDSNAENCIAVAPGANFTLTPEDIKSLNGTVWGAGMLLMQLEIPMETVVEAATAAHKAGVKVVLNPAPAREIPTDLYKQLYLIIPNQTEASLLTGIEVHDEKTAAEAAARLKEKGVKNVIITMGSKGALVTPENGTSTFVEAVKVKAVDTTAAGDTFCGGVCVALSEGLTMQDAARFATKASALAVQKIGAQQSIPRRTEVI